MNAKPTPETDAAEFPVFTWPKNDHPMVVRADIARKLERELEQAKQDAKQHEVDCLRALGERNEARKQRDRLAEAAKLIADEYEDRRCQFGSDYLWIKHEQTKDIENALAIIHENKNE